MGVTSTSAKLKWLVGICYRPEVDELMMMEKNLWFNKLNRQWKQPTPRWFQFSEHQLGQFLSCKESRAVFYRCDTRPFSQANIWYIHQRRQHPGPGFYKIQWTNWGSHTAQVRESWSADETPLDTVQICQEGKEKTSSNQGSRTKKWTSCWPVNYRQGKERHWLGNHLCEGSLWDQDHRPVGREHQEVLELYPTLHKILEFHWRIRGRKFTTDSDKAEILNSFFCPVVTNEPLLDSTTQGIPTTKPIHILRDITITADDIHKRQVKLLANKASGPDSISLNVLRNSPHLDIPLQILFNQSIQTGQVPQD